MKIVFFGTPEFAKIILKKLHQKFPVSLVITQPDRAKGRKQILTPTPVKLFSKKNKIPLCTSTSIIYIIEVLKKVKPDVIITAAYGPPFLTREILELPKYHCLNIHPSLLPKYRGASPIQFTLLNGEKETGITIFQMNEKIDQGKIIIQKSYPVLQNDSAKTLTEKLADFGAKLLLDKLKELKSNKQPLNFFNQDNSKATYARKLKKEDAFIPFASLKKILGRKKLDFNEFPPFIKEQVEKNNLNIKEFNYKSLHNFIRAFYPWPIIWTILPNKKRFKLIKSHIENKKVFLDKIQLEGKNISSDSNFLCQFF